MKNHKNEKIHKAIHENDRKINLHEIKAQTGAGNGYKDRKNINESSLFFISIIIVILSDIFISLER